MYSLTRLLQAIGIASLLVGLVFGLKGDIASQIHYILAGIVIFLTGYIIQRKKESK